MPVSKHSDSFQFTSQLGFSTKKISQYEWSLSDWQAYQAMWMAYAVRVSRPSCLLMFLAASTTCCVVW